MGSIDANMVLKENKWQDKKGKKKKADSDLRRDKVR